MCIRDSRYHGAHLFARHRRAAADKIGVLRQQRGAFGEVLIYQQHDRKRVEALIYKFARRAAAHAFVRRAEPFADDRLYFAEAGFAEPGAEPGGAF